MRGDCFTFADAEDLLPYLDDLGVSHLYLSPILTAAPGSTHGYDVTDPTSVSADLGGADGLARLSAAARSRGMGLIVDIVPNHVGVDKPEQNKWWWDVLKHGRDSAYASYFDIDWTLDNGRIVLPVLGSDNDVTDLVVDNDVLRLGDLAYPIAPGTENGTGEEVHDRQHYRLIGWRHGVCGYRRFFSITSLAGLRQEDRAVFDATHVEVKRWFDEGLVDGVRIDHPDGLSDPTGYLAWLRELTGPQAWIVIEKILAVDEPLDPSLPVAGTTGYDALREIGGLLLDPAGVGPLTDLVDSTGADYHEMPLLARRLKVSAVTETLRSELGRLCRAIVAATGFEHPQLPDAVAALLSRVAVYRSDYLNLSSVLPTALAETVSERPELAEPLAVVAAAVGAWRRGGGASAAAVRRGDGEVDGGLPVLPRPAAGVTQRSRRRARPVRGERRRVPPAGRAAGAAVAARDDGVEHTRHQARRRRPGAHRGAVPGAVAVGGVRQRLGAAHALARPDDRSVPVAEHLRGVARRRHRIRRPGAPGCTPTPKRPSEKRPCTRRGTTPTPSSSHKVHAWIDEVIDGPIATELTSLVARLDEHARNDSLGQKLIQLTAPGVPDVYQGTELWDDSLVDPDNRRPVDFTARREALSALTHPKIRVVTAALALRRAKPAAFTEGGYTPLLAEGPAAAHLAAFVRGSDVVTAVTRHSVRLAETGWGDTAFDTSRRDMGGPDRRWPVQRKHLPCRTVRGAPVVAAGARR